MMNDVLQHDEVKTMIKTGYRPLPLTRKDAALVAALTALQAKLLLLEVGHETWRLRFSGKPGPNAGPEALIAAEWQGHRIAARIPQALLERTLAICLPELSLRDIPDDLFSSTASNLIGMWLAKLPHIASLRIRDIDMNDAGASANNESGRIHLLARHLSPACREGIEYSIALDLDPALLSSLPSLCRDLPSRSSEIPENFPHLPIPLQCEIGKATMPYATLKTLRLGDILFFDGHMGSDSAGPAEIALQLTHRGHPVLSTRLHSPDLMVVTDITMNDRKPFRFEDLLDDTDSALFNPDGAIDDFDDDDAPSDSVFPARHQSGSPDTDTGIGSLSQLPLQLIFDIGECEMRLSDLQALQPGSMIPLGTDRAEMVRVRVNGRVVASGELVEIDGKVGVMLARLAGMQ